MEVTDGRRVGVGAEVGVGDGLGDGVGVGVASSGLAFRVAAGVATGVPLAPGVGVEAVAASAHGDAGNPVVRTTRRTRTMTGNLPGHDFDTIASSDRPS